MPANIFWDRFFRNIYIIPFLAEYRDNLQKAHITPGDMHDNEYRTVFCIKIAMLLGW